MRIALTKAPAPEDKPFECQKDRIAGLGSAMEFLAEARDTSAELTLDEKTALQAKSSERPLSKGLAKNQQAPFLGSTRNKVALRTRTGKGRGTHAIAVGGIVGDTANPEACLFESSLHVDQDDRDHQRKLDKEQEASRIPIPAPAAPVTAWYQNDACALGAAFVFADVKPKLGDFS
jgi:hypothetical protein